MTTRFNHGVMTRFNHAARYNHGVTMWWICEFCLVFVKGKFCPVCGEFHA